MTSHYRRLKSRMMYPQVWYNVIAIVAAVVVAGCAKNSADGINSGRDPNMGAVPSMLQALTLAVADRDAGMTARAVIELGLHAHGSIEVERAITSAFTQAGNWPLPEGIDWPDKVAEIERQYPDPMRRPKDVYGRRNVTLSFLFLEAVGRIEARSGYRFRSGIWGA